MLHHQMAVDMSNAILVHTEDEAVKKLAQNIVDAQKEEITQMQSILDDLPNHNSQYPVAAQQGRPFCCPPAVSLSHWRL